MSVNQRLFHPKAETRSDRCHQKSWRCTPAFLCERIHRNFLTSNMEPVLKFLLEKRLHRKAYLVRNTPTHYRFATTVQLPRRSFVFFLVHDHADHSRNCSPSKSSKDCYALRGSNISCSRRSSMMRKRVHEQLLLGI